MLTLLSYTYSKHVASKSVFATKNSQVVFAAKTLPQTLRVEFTTLSQTLL